MQFYCSDCDKEFGKKHQYDVHIKGVQHQTVIDKKRESQMEQAINNEKNKNYKIMMEDFNKRVGPFYRTYQEKMFSSIGNLKQKKEPPNAKDFNESIIEEYERSRPSKIIKQRRQYLCQFVKQVVGELHPEAKLEVYGSIPLNLDSENSDIDVSIISEENEITLLNSIGDAIESCKSPYFQISRVLQARIPLISIVDTLADNLQLDLSIWKLDKLEIAKVFAAYLSIDDRVTPLTYAVRVWSKARKINNAYTGWINSFGWTVMVVAFLQINSVVPKIEQLDLSKEKQEWQITNTCPVGVLFLQFFQWLIAFDYEKQRISIRHGGITAKEADKFTDDVVFCVERPRTPYQNITRQVCHRTLKVIRREWKRVVRLVQEGAKFQDLCASSDAHKLN